MEESIRPKGGKREGAGRPKKRDEDKIIKLAVSAITEKYGGLQEGFKALLSTGEPALVKFVWEHAVGKPKDNVNVSGGVVFRLRKPGDSNNEEEDAE